MNSPAQESKQPSGPPSDPPVADRGAYNPDRERSDSAEAEALGFEAAPGESRSDEDADAVADAVSDDMAEGQLLDSARSLNGGAAAAVGEPEAADLALPQAPETEPIEPTLQPDPLAVGAFDEDSGDLGLLQDLPEPVPQVSRRKGDWECELSAHNVAVELKRIEDQIRSVLDERDPKRKRKLAGTHRWHELEEDLISLHYSGRIKEEEVRRIRELIQRRHYLFRHLRFMASTRPTWNS